MADGRAMGPPLLPINPPPRACVASHTRTPHHLILAHSPAIAMEAPKPAMTTTTQPQAVQMSECLPECRVEEGCPGQTPRFERTR